MIAAAIGRMLGLRSNATRPIGLFRADAAPVTVDAAGNPTHAWQPGDALLAEHNRQIILKRIARLVGLPTDDFETYYRCVACQFAEFVQLMPASETHHHARLGGLLDHSLDVTERALAIRRSYLLPPNRPPEVVVCAADRWTYSVFLAALLHDVGKAATDLEVDLYDQSGRPCGRWNPNAGPMQAARYYIRFRGERRYEQHQRVTPFIARSLLPKEALAWFSCDQDLMSSWLSSLAGDYDDAGPLGVIVAQADGQSVAADLGAGDAVRLTSSRKRPLCEMLMLALKHLFEDERVQINRPGAEAWVTETDVWLVSKVGGDLLRDWLIEQGITSVPKNNNRVFDELQQHRLCTPTEADRAVWSMRVTAGDFDQRLTMLRFPIEAVWPDTDRRPQPLEGEIVAGTAGAPSSDVNEVNAGSDSDQGERLVLEGDDLSPTVGSDDLSVSAPVTSLDVHVESQSASASTRCGGRIDWKRTVDEFCRWLAEGIAKKRLALNCDRRDGEIWTVEEGLFVRTPGVMRDFATERGIDDYVGLQRALERQKGC